MQDDQQPPVVAAHPIGVHQPLVACDFAGAELVEAFAVVLVPLEPRCGPGVKLRQEHATVEAQQLRGRQRPHRTEHLTGFGRQGQTLGDLRAAVGRARAVLSLADRLSDRLASFVFRHGTSVVLHGARARPDPMVEAVSPDTGDGLDQYMPCGRMGYLRLPFPLRGYGKRECPESWSVWPIPLWCTWIWLSGWVSSNPCA